MGVRGRFEYLAKRATRLFFFLTYIIKSKIGGISDDFIRHLYASLIEMDWEDFVKVGDFEVMAFAQTVHIRIPKFHLEITLNETRTHCIYIHQRLAYADWIEVYRSTWWVHSFQFYSFLKQLERALYEKSEELNGKL